MQINVTSEHLAAAKPTATKNAAVLALAEAGYPGAIVYDNLVLLPAKRDPLAMPGWRSYLPESCPAEVRRYLLRLKRGQTSEPFSFDIPDEPT